MLLIEATDRSLIDKLCQLICEKLFACCAHFMSSIVRASKNISGLVNIEVTSPARLMKTFVNAACFHFLQVRADFPSYS